MPEETATGGIQDALLAQAAQEGVETTGKTPAEILAEVVDAAAQRAVSKALNPAHEPVPLAKPIADKYPTYIVMGRANGSKAPHGAAELIDYSPNRLEVVGMIDRARRQLMAELRGE